MSGFDRNALRYFKLGEKKYIDWVLKKNRVNDVLVVERATWQLKDLASGEIKDAGTCEIERDTVSVLLHPENKGNFVLEVTISVPPEVVVGVVHISVD